MARNVATKWIIGIVIYFVILIFFLATANSVVSEFSLYDDDTITYNGGGGIGYALGSCVVPRVLINPYTGLEVWVAAHYIKCSNFALYLNSTECNYLEGCNWDNATEVPWYLAILGLPDTPAGCYGKLNTTYYDPNDTTTITCNWPQNVDENTCNYLGCSWVSNTGNAFDVADTQTSYTKGFFRVAEIIGNVVTLRVTFGTTNILVNALLTFFFIWIPLAILLMSGYIMVR